MVEINSGSDLKELLKERNLNVRKVSMMAGIRPSTLYAVVQQDRKPSLGILLKLAEVLPIRIDNIKKRGLTGNSDASSNDLPLTEDAVRIGSQVSLRAGIAIYNSTAIPDIASDVQAIHARLNSMTTGELWSFVFQSMFAQMAINIMSVLVTVIMYIAWILEGTLTE